MVPPACTVVAGVNTRTGLMELPATPPEVMDVKTIPVMAAASNPAVIVVSTLVESLKPAVTIARAPPRVSPLRVTVIEEMPVSAPPVVSTIEELPAVAAGDEAVKETILLSMDVTEPKK